MIIGPCPMTLFLLSEVSLSTMGINENRMHATIPYVEPAKEE